MTGRIRKLPPSRLRRFRRQGLGAGREEEALPCPCAIDTKDFRRVMLTCCAREAVVAMDSYIFSFVLILHHPFVLDSQHSLCKL
jgi:hypothetical protein